MKHVDLVKRYFKSYPAEKFNDFLFFACQRLEKEGGTLPSDLPDEVKEKLNIPIEKPKTMEFVVTKAEKKRGVKKFSEEIKK